MLNCNKNVQMESNVPNERCEEKGSNEFGPFKIAEFEL